MDRNYPGIKGNLEVVAYDEEDPEFGEKWKEVVISGDPEGLRSFAELLIALADLDQKTLDEYPDYASEHVHLEADFQGRQGDGHKIISFLPHESSKLMTVPLGRPWYNLDEGLTDISTGNYPFYYPDLLWQRLKGNCDQCGSILYKEQLRTNGLNSTAPGQDGLKGSAWRWKILIQRKGSLCHQAMHISDSSSPIIVS